MLIESLEQKTRLALFTVATTIIACTIICGYTVFSCLKMVQEERSQIYVVDGDIPFLAERSKQEANFVMEAKADIQLFHQYFFNLPPDDDYIKWTLGKAMYMADGTAMKQNRLWKKLVFSLTLYHPLLYVQLCVIQSSWMNRNARSSTLELS